MRGVPRPWPREALAARARAIAGLEALALASDAMACDAMASIDGRRLRSGLAGLALRLLWRLFMIMSTTRRSLISRLGGWGMSSGIVGVGR